MSIRKKTLLVITGIALLMVLVSQLLFRVILLNHFDDLERSATERSVRSAIHTLSDAHRKLATLAVDWAMWDDAYRFVQDRNQAFINTNYIDATFTSIRINAIMYLDASGDVVYAKAFDLEQGREVPLPEELGRAVARGSFLLAHTGPTDIKSGIMQASAHPLAIASVPVVTSAGTSPIAGTVILGRFIDGAEIAALSHLVQAPISVLLPVSPDLPGEVRSKLESLPGGTIVTEPVSERTIAGYALLADVFGAPALVIRVDAAREIYRQGQETTAYLSLMVVAVGVAAFTALYLLVDRQVLRRLGHIAADVRKVGSASDFSSRIAARGRDEIGILATSINDMLSGLERSQAETAASEERYRTILDLGTRIGEAVVIVEDKAGTTGGQKFFTDNWVKLTGYSHAELTGMSFFDLLRPADRTAFLDLYRGADGEVLLGPHETAIRRKDGQLSPIETSWARTVRQGRDVTFMFVRDITRRKQAEAALRQSEEKYRTLVTNLRVAAVRATPEPNGRFIEVNPAAADLLGYTREELLSMSPASMYADPAERAVVLARMASGETKGAEVEFRRKDGRIITVYFSARPVKDDEGNILYFDSIAEDMTERKRAQQELERLYRQERRLREDLEIEFKKRTEFTRALVHELKTPITPILASSELLLQEAKDRTLERVANNIYEGALNLNRRIDELLDLAKGETGTLKMRFLSVSPEKLVQETASRNAPLAKSNGLALEATLPPALPQVRADEDRLRQVLQNLVNNAVKFTPAGGIIRLSARNSGTSVTFEVSDTGPGMEPEELGRLFQPYYRLERDRDRLSGLGLGLALSKQIVELHGGSIEVKSRKGEGSTFYVSIPLAQATAPESQAEGSKT